MKRYSKKGFSQIMINKLLKADLYKLKDVIGKEMGATWKLGYGDVISYVVKHFKESRKIETLIEPKLLTKYSFSEAKLNVSYSLEN